MEFKGVPLCLLANLLTAAYLLAAFASRRRPRTLRLLTAAFAAFALAYYLLDAVVQPREEPALDFASYYVTADDLLTGGNPYLHYRELLAGGGPYPERLAAFGIPDIPRPAYPPLFYLLVSPLTLLPFPAAWAAWIGVNAGLGALALFLAARAAGLPSGWPWVAAAALAAVAHPTIANVAHGQANLVVAAFLFGGVLAWVRGKETAAGVLLAAAALIKIFPLVFLAYFVAARRWRAAAAFAVTAAAFAALAAAVWGPGLARDYVTFAVAPYLLTLLPYKLNASAPAFLACLIDSLHSGPEPRSLYYGIMGLTAAAVTAAIIWAGRRRPAPAVAAAFLTTLALLANNWTLFHYLVLLALPFLVAVSGPRGLLGSPRYGLVAGAYLLVAWRLDFLAGVRLVGYFVPAVKTAGMAILLGVLLRNEIKKAAARPRLSTSTFRAPTS